jgi:flagellar basal-body rod protein FlgF
MAWRGVYSSAYGMLAGQTQLDVVANNLANASTNGFKRDTAVVSSFESMLIARYNDDPTGAGAPEVGKLGLGAFVAQTAAHVTDGGLVETGNPLDVALLGDGFFTVRTPRGIRYTRQGNFVQNADGILVTPQGYPVLVGGQPVGQPGAKLGINELGEVTVNGVPQGKLDIVSLNQVGGLKKEGDGLYVKTGKTASTVSVTPRPNNPLGAWQVRPGYLESSNVQPVLEMVNMISIMRAYEANQKALQAQDETMGKAVNEVGRV